LNAFTTKDTKRLEEEGIRNWGNGRGTGTVRGFEYG
jgi:hypothetical protein